MTVSVSEIPSAVKAVTVSVGIPCPQDGDSRRQVWVSTTDSTEIPTPSYFSQDIEGLPEKEEASIVDGVIISLRQQGFKQPRLEHKKGDIFRYQFERE